MKRNKDSTKQKLIDAVGQIILAQGFQSIGINSVARTAGVDKVLIYRYFGSLNGLLEAYVRQQDFFSRLDQLFGAEVEITDKAAFSGLSKTLFIEQLRTASQNTALRQILLWELTERNPVTDAIARAREQQGMRLLNKIGEKIDFSEIDIPAITDLLIGGIYYLVLRSRHVDVFSGIPMGEDVSWQRFEAAIELLIDLVADHAYQKSKNNNKGGLRQMV